MLIVSASRSPPGLGRNSCRRCCNMVLVFIRICVFGITLAQLCASFLLPWGHFGSTLNAFCWFKKRLGRPRCSKTPQSEISPLLSHILGHLLESFFQHILNNKISLCCIVIKSVSQSCFFMVSELFMWLLF